MQSQENFILRKATPADQAVILEIVQQAILRRKNDGSSQWQDGYPNPDTIREDIENGFGYIFEIDGETAAYSALIFNNEPAYENIDGKWLSDNDFLVIHRVAVSDGFLGKGIASKIFLEIENFAKQQQVFSIKLDTNFDNLAMLKILEKLNYTYCGEVYFRGSARKAFEKLLR